MKKAGFVLLRTAVALLLTLTAASCVTPGKTAVLADMQPIALVSVVSNWDINWHGEDAVNPDFIGSGTRRALRADPDLTVAANAEELINTAEGLVRKIMPRTGLLVFADKDAVFAAAAYREASLNIRRMSSPYVIPNDYRLINPRNKNFPRALAEETDVQRSMFVEFDFFKTMRSGFGKNGQMGALIEMRVLIVDASGQTVFTRSSSVSSRDTIAVSNGRYSRSGLMTLLESAITDALFDFLDHLEDRLADYL